MNDGVALLIERMKTNPEEFVVEEGIVRKWDGLVRSYEGVLPPEDIKAYKEALNTLLQQQFTEKVMEELVEPKKSVKDQWGESAISLATQTLGQFTAQPYSTSTGTITLETSEHMKAHLKALQQEYTKKPKKEHKTIFGKLFNYQ